MFKLIVIPFTKRTTSIKPAKLKIISKDNFIIYVLTYIVNSNPQNANPQKANQENGNSQNVNPEILTNKMLTRKR